MAGQQFITIGTGGFTGAYYPAGGEIFVWSIKDRKEQGIRCSVVSTGGFVYNISNIQSRELDMGISQSDWQYHAYHGTSKFTDAREFKDLFPRPFYRAFWTVYGCRPS